MLFILITAIIFTLEYHLKNHMEHARTLDGQRPLADGKIILKKYYNTGAACNFLSRHPVWIRRIHTIMLTAVSALLVRTLPKKHAALAKTGLSFLTGGGLSNLHDRILKGHVVDYISFGFGPKRFQKLVFNTADFFIFAGILLCMAHILRKEDL